MKRRWCAVVERLGWGSEVGAVTSAGQESSCERGRNLGTAPLEAQITAGGQTELRLSAVRPRDFW